MLKLFHKISVSHRQIIINWGWRILQTIMKQGISLLIFFISIKSLTINEFGLYNYLLAIIFFLVMFCDFGISVSTTKYVAEYKALNSEKTKLILFNATVLILGISFFVLLVTLIGGGFFFKDNYYYILHLIPLLFLIPFSSVLDGIYRGNKSFKKLTIISSIAGLSAIVFAVPIIKYYGLIGAFYAQIILYLLQSIFLLFGQGKVSFKFNKLIIQEIGSYSFVYGLAVLGYYLYSRIDILILGQFNYFEQIATYELLNKIFLILLLPATLLGQVIAPDFTTCYAHKEYTFIFQKWCKLVRLLLIGGTLFFVFSWLFVPILINIFIPQYHNQYLLNIILPVSLSYALQAYCAPLNAGIIVATGYAKLMTYINLSLGVVNLAICLILQKLFGYVGIMYGTLISTIVGLSWLHIAYYFTIKKLSK